MDYIDLALRYGGFTALDKVYLTHRLEGLSDRQKLDFVTPPPSVINAYFAELYQKKSPQVATDYFFELSKACLFFQSHPSFKEEKPFIRLNLSGKSYGFTYRDETETGLVFAEKKEKVTPQLLFEIAQIFPHYMVFQEEESILMQPLFDEEVLSKESVTALTDLEILENGAKKLTGYNQEELYEIAQSYQGKVYYRSENRTAMMYII